MRKKKLQPDKLDVQGFPTLPEHTEPEGTVNGYATGVYGPRCPSACPNCLPSIDHTDP